MGLYALVLACTLFLLKQGGWVTSVEIDFLAALIWSLAVLIRAKNFFSLRLYERMEQQFPLFKGKLETLSQLCAGKATVPDPKLLSRYLHTFPDLSRLRYPVISAMRKAPLFIVIQVGVLLAVFFAGILLNGSQSERYASLRLTPPSYISQSSRFLSEQEREASVYPGTLLRLQVEGVDFSPTLNDSLGRRFRPIAGGGGSWTWELRLLEPLDLNLKTEDGASLEWSFDLLNDLPPEVKWSVLPEKSKSWDPVDLEFTASDDIGLNEAFITVNDSEIEYAGEPEGKRFHRYGWSFDPIEHVNIDGGKVELRVRVYDTDRVRGPKKAETEAVVWNYPGVETQADEQLDLLDELSRHLQERIADLHQPREADHQLTEKMKKMSNELRNNPALDPTLSMLTELMAQENDRMMKQIDRQKPSEPLRNQELQMQERNAMYLDFIRSKLNNILNTLRTAKLVKKLAEMADKLESGESVDEKDFTDTFNRLSEKLKDDGVNAGIRDPMLQAMDKATIANMMGHKLEAAQMLREVSESLRQRQNQAQNQKGNSALEQRYREMREELDRLIEEQKRLNMEVSQGFSPKVRESLQHEIRIRSEQVLKDLHDSREYKAFKDLSTALREAFAAQGDIKDEDMGGFLEKLNSAGEITDNGQKLADLSDRINNLLETLKSKGVEAAFQELTTLPGNSEMEAMTDSDQLRQSWARLKSLLDQKPSAPDPSKMGESTQQAQQQQGASANSFSHSFRRDFSLAIPIPTVFMLADQASQLAQNAGKLMMSKNPSTWPLMQGSLNSFETLRKLLDQMGQQGKNSMQGQQRLKIDRDGKLKLQRGNKPDSKDGEMSTTDVQIPMPEDFRKPQGIEDRLKRELETLPPGPDRDRFREYMIDLLQ